MLAWLDKDGKLLFAARAARTFGYGFLSVTLAIYLDLIGFDRISIGIILTATLVNGILFTLLASFFADRWGRRRMLIIFGILMILSGLIFFFTENYVVLIFAVLIGTINATGTEVGPFLSIEQAMIPQTCSNKKRNTAFAIYNTLGTFAMSAGILVVGFPEYLQAALNLTEAASVKPLFLLYSILGIITIAIYALMSKRIEIRSSEISKRPILKILSPKSRRIVTKLSVLFGVDSFGGGFVIQSILSYWFFIKFGIDFVEISYIFAAAGVLTALSYLAAAKIANRIGLVNTMVFTHIPSNVLLMLVPVAPTLPLAVGLLLARMSLSQMDVPTRQSYIVAIVEPGERVAASGLTSIARNTAQAISPSITGYVLQFLSLTAPFFIGGGLKIAYDIALYLNFRKIKAPEEMDKST
ncbi:MAG: MFS transporter [Nitrososphaerales archaeon]